MENFYESVYSQDTPDDGPHGWIQWKGTTVCMDTHCACGYHGHVDTDFFYFYECPACHAKYAVGQTVKLIPLTAEQADYVNKDHLGFQTCDLEDD